MKLNNLAHISQKNYQDLFSFLNNDTIDEQTNNLGIFTEKKNNIHKNLNNLNKFNGTSNDIPIPDNNQNKINENYSKRIKYVKRSEGKINNTRDNKISARSFDNLNNLSNEIYFSDYKNSYNLNKLNNKNETNILNFQKHIENSTNHIINNKNNNLIKRKKEIEKKHPKKHAKSKQYDSDDNDDPAFNKTNNFKKNIEDSSGDKFIENGGFMGFCLLKYQNYLINLHKIKIKDSNFFVNSNDGILEFSICENIISYDDTRKGLFINRLKNVAYAGFAEDEKFFVINNFDEASKKNNQIKNLENQKINLKKNSPKNIETSDENLTEQDENIFKSISIYLPQGDICYEDLSSNIISRFSIMYEITCDPNAIKPIVVNSEDFDANSCFNKILIKSRYVCSSKLKKYISWYDRLLINKQIFTLIVLILGIYLMYFSKIQMKTSLCIVICLLSYLLLGSLNILDGEVSGKSIFFMLLIPFICLIYYPYFNILYWIFSFLMAFTLQDMFICLTGKFVIENDIIDYEAYKYLICSIFMLIFILITLKFDYDSVYWQTSLIGAYFFVRGISIKFGKFPDRQYINLLLKHREFMQYDRAMGGVTVYYLISILILWIISFTIQRFYIDSFIKEMKSLENLKNSDKMRNKKNYTKKENPHINEDKLSKRKNDTCNIQKMKEESGNNKDIKKNIHELLDEDDDAENEIPNRINLSNTEKNSFSPNKNKNTNWIKKNDKEENSKKQDEYNKINYYDNGKMNNSYNAREKSNNQGNNINKYEIDDQKDFSHKSAKDVKFKKEENEDKKQHKKKSEKEISDPINEKNKDIPNNESTRLDDMNNLLSKNFLNSLGPIENENFMEDTRKKNQNDKQTTRSRNFNKQNTNKNPDQDNQNKETSNGEKKTLQSSRNLYEQLYNKPENENYINNDYLSDVKNSLSQDRSENFNRDINKINNDSTSFKKKNFND